MKTHITEVTEMKKYTVEKTLANKDRKVVVKTTNRKEAEYVYTVLTGRKMNVALYLGGTKIKGVLA